MREHWPQDGHIDHRFEGLNGRVAELWHDGEMEGYAYIVIMQFAEVQGPFWRRRLRHGGWEPQVHLALRPQSGGPIEYQFDDWFVSWPEDQEQFYREVVLNGVLSWPRGSLYDLRWVPEADTASVIDRYFWVEEDVTADPSAGRAEKT